MDVKLQTQSQKLKVYGFEEMKQGRRSDFAYEHLMSKYVHVYGTGNGRVFTIAEPETESVWLLVCVKLQTQSQKPKAYGFE